ncbi:hypothetical protein QQP08_000017 [Theobroma cacao]|uniref:Uncharacterized protein n=1 Tax=Theobroma cacao TaxID=3641 RepID=A0A061DSE0_THECC|nr:Uncharacterized protein TCM_001751 [Theobroma cacao]WRX07530.1 hypothetical protein QQP08_000017 [Theobroma cacao]
MLREMMAAIPKQALLEKPEAAKIANLHHPDTNRQNRDALSTGSQHAQVTCLGMGLIIREVRAVKAEF